MILEKKVGCLDFRVRDPLEFHNGVPNDEEFTAWKQKAGMKSAVVSGG